MQHIFFARWACGCLNQSSTENRVQIPPNQDRSFSGTSSNLRLGDSNKVEDDSRELITDEAFDKSYQCRKDVVMNSLVSASLSCNNKGDFMNTVDNIFLIFLKYIKIINFLFLKFYF